MTGRERQRARKVAERQERIRQAKAVKRARPGGLAGAGVNVAGLAQATRESVPEDLLATVVAKLEGQPERQDVAAWMGEEAR